jgi:hypothetical protein
MLLAPAAGGTQAQQEPPETHPVKNPFAARDISDSLRRRTDLAIAVAQERLMSTHVDHALELIGLVGDQVAFNDALDIYTRLLRLSDDEARVITTRALAILGERASTAQAWPEAMATRDVVPDSAISKRQLFMENVRQRLRGRVNEDLRRWIELEAARTEVAILNTHVENALHFVELVGNELSFSEGVELYLEALDVRESVSEVAYYISLARLAEGILPKDRLRSVDLRPGSSEADRRLRVVETSPEA